MARVSIYLPDDLAERAKAAGLNISGLARSAVAEALIDRGAVAGFLDRVAARGFGSEGRGLDVGVKAVRAVRDAAEGV